MLINVFTLKFIFTGPKISLKKVKTTSEIYWWDLPGTACSTYTCRVWWLAYKRYRPSYRNAVPWPGLGQFDSGTITSNSFGYLVPVLSIKFSVLKNDTIFNYNLKLFEYNLAYRVICYVIMTLNYLQLWSRAYIK